MDVVRTTQEQLSANPWMDGVRTTQEQLSANLLSEALNAPKLIKMRSNRLKSAVTALPATSRSFVLKLSTTALNNPYIDHYCERI